MARFVVEADGGSRGNPGPAAYGAVLRDAETGDVLVERAEHIGTATNNVAEYRGLIAGLTAARELDPSATVEARLDSKLIVEQMAGRWKIKHPSMRPLALQAREILPPENVTYVWVPRERNKHADRLANEALDAAARGQKWSESASTAALDRAVVSSGDEAEVEPVPTSLVGWDVGMGAPSTLLLLRHGETEHTAQKRFSGSDGADPPLTSEGERQARAAADRLVREGAVDAVVSSPMRRARQTADIVADALGQEVHEVADVRECAFGEWEGLTFAEVQEGWPELLASWLADPTVAAPGGESFDAVRRRVQVARDKLRARHPHRTVLVVTHVVPVKLLVADALGAPLSVVYRMELSPASLTEVQWYEGGATSMRRFNDAAHLSG
ncbi:MAG: bifunctional RNase H/acid phosphatase [Spirochaetaceae bacterium]|nr:bifunctional RNase H/acid phosphatase [Spirochaetaceae bacterium]